MFGGKTAPSVRITDGVLVRLTNFPGVRISGIPAVFGAVAIYSSWSVVLALAVGILLFGVFLWVVVAWFIRQTPSRRRDVCRLIRSVKS